MKNKRKLLVPLTALSALIILQGCGSDKKEVVPTGAAAYAEGTYPRFDPVTSDVPFNTDLVFAKAAVTDGTADVYCPETPCDSLRAGINGLDGFSTSAYFDVMISGSVDPASVLPLQTVFLVEVKSLTSLVPATFDTQVVSLDGGTNNVVRIRPTVPLNAKSKYLVFLTNGIQDSQGKPLTRSWTYNALQDATSPIIPSLKDLRPVITGWQALASGFLAAAAKIPVDDAKSKLVLSYTFTTTDAQTPLKTMAAPRAALVDLQEAKGVDSATALINAQALDNAGLLSTPKQRELGISPLTARDLSLYTGLAANVGKLYTGYIKLPYYQTAASGSEAFGTYLTRNWQPSLQLAGAINQTLPKDVDGTYNFTYRFPFAAKTADESVPLQVTLPEQNNVPAFPAAPSATCGLLFGSTGYPVVIYLHGITSDRSSVVALGHTLASKCVATVAIDLPVHGIPAYSASGVNGVNPLASSVGLNVEKNPIFASYYGANAPHERHFNVAGAGGAPAPMNFTAPTARDGSGAQFINLGYMANTRDNLRQGVMDMLNLNASLKGINEDFLAGLGVSLDLNKVYVVGLSLGGIIGTTFTAVNEAARADDADKGLTSNLNPIRGLVASAAGTQTAYILTNSATFAPVINAGLAGKGLLPGTSNYEKFVYTTQSTVDSGDVVNFAQQLAAEENVPVLLQQINNDLVIPNQVSGAPLTGTAALANLLNADPLGLGQVQLGKGYVRLTEGGHASLLRIENNTPLVTAELQAQVVSFVLGAGNVAVGTRAHLNIQTP